jgi:hypothetical protein
MRGAMGGQQPMVTKLPPSLQAKMDKVGAAQIDYSLFEC